MFVIRPGTPPATDGISPHPLPCTGRVRVYLTIYINWIPLVASVLEIVRSTPSLPCQIVLPAGGSRGWRGRSLALVPPRRQFGRPSLTTKSTTWTQRTTLRPRLPVVKRTWFGSLKSLFAFSFQPHHVTSLHVTSTFIYHLSSTTSQPTGPSIREMCFFSFFLFFSYTCRRRRMVGYLMIDD